MANVIILTVEDNTAPDRVITLERNGTVINLSARTVFLKITNAKTGVATNGAGGAAVSVTDATNGVVTYTPAATDFPDEGRYFGEFIINHPASKTEYLHNYLLIVARAKS